MLFATFPGHAIYSIYHSTSTNSRQWMGQDYFGLERVEREREREREREGIHYVHWASKAYEDESGFMSEALLGWQ